MYIFPFHTDTNDTQMIGSDVGETVSAAFLMEEKKT